MVELYSQTPMRAPASISPGPRWGNSEGPTRDVIVIVDEAYIDFAGPSRQGRLPRYDNAGGQTFSKSRSMARCAHWLCCGSPA